MDVAEIAADRGWIRIADKALAVLVRNACLDVLGVAAMDSRFSNTLSSRIAGEDAEGVHISIRDNKVNASLYLLLYHGVRAPEVALRVQERVKEALADSAELAVGTVDIFVQGIIFGEERRFTHDG